MSAALLTAAALILLASGLAHGRHFERTVDAVRSQSVLAPPLARPAVAVLAVVELGLGGATVASVLMGLPGQRVWGLVCAALLLTLAGYAHLAWSRRSHGAVVTCACGVGEAPLGAWVTARAALLALVALWGGLSAPAAAGLMDRPLHELVMLVCATLAFAVGLTVLPSARASVGDLSVPEVSR